MTKDKFNPISITRDDINAAMEQFFAKGGKINRIETEHNSLHKSDPLGLQEGTNFEEGENFDLRTDIPMATTDRW